MIELYVPETADLWFRRELLSDPETMSYNKGYDLGFPEYHNDTGCIDFPEENWGGWYARWVNAEPERFYAFLRLKETGTLLGEVNLFQTAGLGVYEMGIVLHSVQRGKGYSQTGIRLLLDHAFRKLGAKKVTNCFEKSRKAALRIHRAAGFEVEKEENGLLHLAVTKEAYSRAETELL